MELTIGVGGKTQHWVAIREKHLFLFLFFIIIIFPYINMSTPVLWIIKVTVKEKVGSTLYLSRIDSRNSFFSAGRAGVQGREDAPGDPRGH